MAVQQSRWHDACLMSTPSHGAATARSTSLRWTLLAACVCLIIYGSLFPFVGWRTPGDFHRLDGAAALHDVSATDVLANIVLYLPLGFLAGMGQRMRTAPVPLLAALLLSVGLETAQAFLPGRVASWLDVATNVTGTGMGILLAGTASKVMRWPDRGWGHDLAIQLRSDRMAWLAIAALAAWGCAQLIPFAPSIGISDLKAGLKPLWQILHGACSVDLWRCAIYASATAGLTITGSSVLPVPRWYGAVAIYLLAILPLKVLVVGRQLSPEALAGTFTGVAVGVALWCSSRRRAEFVAALLVTISIVLNEVHPGAPGTATHAFNWIPLHAQLVHPINGMANLADTVWPSLALAYLVLRLGLRSLWYLLPVIALLLVAGEVAQLRMPGRYPDITTVLTGVAAWFCAAVYIGIHKIRNRN